MNLEEAKANIGKEVVLDESTKPYKNGTLILLISSNDFIKGILLDVDHYSTAKVDTLDGFHLFINIEHLKLKEQPMQNYKIKVTPETSAEVQELFFELGCKWYSGTREVKHQGQSFLFVNDRYQIEHDNDLECFELDEGEEINLPQLRDIVVLKRNYVGDATHIQKNDKSNKYYVGDSVYNFNGVWVKTTISKSDISGCLKSISNKDKEMTWEDALDAVKDGKAVEVKNISWFDINDLNLGQIKKGKAFRIKPQTIHIDSGDYTKEDLLKIAGEME